MKQNVIEFAKFETKEEAVKEFDKLKKTNDYVVIILSKGKYYVETESNMIRNFETVVKRFEGR